MGIEDVGVRLVAEGAAQFESALKAADKSIVGFGDSAQDATKKIAAMDKAFDKTFGAKFDSYAKGLQKGTINGQDFQSMLVGSAKNSGLLSTDLSRLAQSSGLFSDSQLRAASAMRAAQSKADELTQAVANGTMSTREAGKAFGDFTRTLDTGGMSISGMVASLSGVIAVGAGVVGAIVAIGAAVKGLGDNFQAYAFQVDDLARTIGSTPQEASKLIQVADDVRVSYQTLTSALEASIRKGFAPTIQGLGQMSDAYLKLPPGIERTRFLMETFGRSGADLARLMELGSKQIDAMGKSIEGTSLIMDPAGVKAATAYWEELDKLGDQIEMLKQLAGKPIVVDIIIPVLSSINKVLDATQKEAKAITTTGKAYKEGSGSLLDYVLSLNKLGAGQEGQFIALQLFLEWLNKTNQATSDLSATTQISIRSINDYKKSTLDATTSAYLARENIDGMGLSLANMERYANTAGSATNVLVHSIDNLGTKAGASAQKFDQSISDITRKAQEAANIKKIDIGLNFTYPNIAEQMKNLMDSIDWQAAGGGALQKFMEGFAQNVAPLTDEQKKQVAAKVGAVDIALEVKTGEITNTAGLEAIKSLFKEVGGIDTKGAQELIDKISKMTPPDITAYLNSIVSLAAPETTKEAATQTGILNEKMIGTGNAITTNIGFVRDWNGAIETLGLKSQNAVGYVGALNTQIKSLPESKTIDVYIVTHGGVPGETTVKPGSEGQTPLGGGQAKGGPVTSDTIYLVGERGPEFFIPDTAGRILPNYQTDMILSRMVDIIPMARGGRLRAASTRPKTGKMTSAEEKAQNKYVKATYKEKGGGSEGTVEETKTEDSSLTVISTAFEYAQNLLHSTVAEYNYLIKTGTKPSQLTEKKKTIDLLGRQVSELAKLKQTAEVQQALKNTGEALPTGLSEAIPWLNTIIEKFKSLFALLNSSPASSAMDAIKPLISESPAPLAVGLSQIKRQMDQLSSSSLPRFYNNVSQLARPNQYSTNQSSVYNINVPVSATISNQSDIRILAYAVAKEIAANVRT